MPSRGLGRRGPPQFIARTRALARGRSYGKSPTRSEFSASAGGTRGVARDDSLASGFAISLVENCEAACNAQTKEDVYLELPRLADKGKTEKTMVKTNIPVFLNSWCD